MTEDPGGCKCSTWQRLYSVWLSIFSRLNTVWPQVEGATPLLYTLGFFAYCHTTHTNSASSMMNETLSQRQ